MTPDHRIGPEGRDDEVTRILRRIHAAPGTEEYWRGLEARIMAGVAGDASAESGWWLPLTHWARAGVAAAAVALLVAGVALWREREVREQAAIETVLLQANPPLSQLAAVAGTAPDSESVLRNLLTP